MIPNRARLSVLFALVLSVFALAGLLPATAGAAALGGENGTIFFTSGRGGPAGNDGEAKIFGRTILSSTGLGVVNGPFTTTTGKQHKHSSISPDRMLLAFSRGTPGTPLTEDFDIFLLNIDTGVETPITTPGDGVTSDRPAFSPDGKFLAWDNEEGANDTGGRDILVRNLQSGVTSNITNTAGIANAETKPAWTPDSQTLYYAKGDPTGANTMNINKRPATGGSETSGVPDSGASEFQPSISPDGTKVCFTLGTGFNSSTSVYYALTASPATQTLIHTGDGGNINCVFSPDNTLIAYTQGVFTAGALVMEKADGSDLAPITLTDEPAHFDGNADWAIDGRAQCSDVTVKTTPGKPVTVPLKCVDTGPQYEQTDVVEILRSVPAPVNGKVSEEVQGNPATVVYTPNAGFLGTEVLKFTGFDAHNFAAGGDKTITIQVALEPPVLSGLKIASKIKHAKKNPKLSTKKKGTTISFTLSKDANVSFSFKRTGKLSKSATSGKFTLAGKAGLNRVVFYGKTSRTKTLALGKYKMSVSAVDSDGAKAPTQTKRFSLK
ncbi:MAG: TolB family protein [Solirubrobacterales bacterium]